MTISNSVNSKGAPTAGAFHPSLSNAGGSAPEAMVPAAGQTVAARELHQTRERIVLVMMALVAAALAAVMRMHFGYPVVTASISGGILWSAFLALHTLKKRSAQIGGLRQDVSRLEQELGRLRTQSSAMPRPLGTTTSDLPQATGAGAHAAQKKSPARVPAETDQKRNSNIPASVIVAQSPPNYSGQAGNDVAPDRISPEARWETPELGRMGNLAPPIRSDASAQKEPSLASTQVGSPREAISAPTTKHGASLPPQLAARPQAPDLFEAPSWSGTSLTSQDPLRDAWSFRPKEAVEARSFAPDAGSRDENALQSYAPIPAPHGSNSIESDLEVVQRKIKAMADEVNAAEAGRMRPFASPKPVAEPIGSYSAPAPSANKGASPQGSAGFGTAAMAIEDGISALKSAAGAMRAPAAPHSASVEPATGVRAQTMLPPADLLIPASAQTIAVSARPAPAQSEATLASRSSGEPAPASKPADMMPAFDLEMPAPIARQPDVRDGRVAEIAKAIESKAMDVLLTPIVGLGDYAVTHFEVAVRLLGGNGALIDQSEDVLTLAGNHLLALFDAERLSRTAAVAELLESRGKNGSVMTAATGASMSDTNFLETFARVYESRNSISGQLVLTFSQADVEAFGTATWQALNDMHSFGFRFALDHVTHLGMDFEYLAQCGFTFVKLPAQVFLKGLPSDSGFITVNDICRHLARCGLTLVVESVDDEALLAKVFGFGALFGQGQLFGAPRQISLDTLAPAHSAAA